LAGTVVYSIDELRDRLSDDLRDRLSDDFRDHLRNDLSDDLRDNHLGLRDNLRFRRLHLFRRIAQPFESVLGLFGVGVVVPG
jgi:hypothetical protein